MKTLKITGIGHSSMSPNQIELKFRLYTLDKNYEKLNELHSQKLEALISSLTTLNFKKEDIKTSSFNIQTKYKSIRTLSGEYKEEFEGYYINQNLVLVFDYNMDLLDKILNNISSSKTNPKLSINFTIKEKEEFENKLLENAYTDARKKAEILAKASNQVISSIVSIDYSFGSIHLYSDTMYDDENMHYKEASKCSIGSNITPLDIEKSENVTFIFELKEKE